MNIETTLKISISYFNIIILQCNLSHFNELIDGGEIVMPNPLLTNSNYTSKHKLINYSLVSNYDLHSDIFPTTETASYSL